MLSKICLSTFPNHGLYTSIQSSLKIIDASKSHFHIVNVSNNLKVSELNFPSNRIARVTLPREPIRVNYKWASLSNLIVFIPEWLSLVNLCTFAFVKERFHNAVEIDILGIFWRVFIVTNFPPQKKILQGRNLFKVNDVISIEHMLCSQKSSFTFCLASWLSPPQRLKGFFFGWGGSARSFQLCTCGTRRTADWYNERVGMSCMGTYIVPGHIFHIHILDLLEVLCLLELPCLVKELYLHDNLVLSTELTM